QRPRALDESGGLHEPGRRRPDRRDELVHVFLHGRDEIVEIDTKRNRGPVEAGNPRNLALIERTKRRFSGHASSCVSINASRLPDRPWPFGLELGAENTKGRRTTAEEHVITPHQARDNALTAAANWLPGRWFDAKRYRVRRAKNLSRLFA